MRHTLIILSALLCVILAPMTRTMRGYGWQLHRAGDKPYQTENGHAWAEAGSVPAEWEAIKSDPQIDQAQLYTNAQSHRRADKRRILDSKESS